MLYDRLPISSDSRTILAVHAVYTRLKKQYSRFQGNSSMDGIIFLDTSPHIAIFNIVVETVLKQKSMPCALNPAAMCCGIQLHEHDH